MKFNNPYRCRLSLAFILALIAAIAGFASVASAQKDFPPDHEAVPPPPMGEEHGYLGVTLEELTEAERNELQFQGQGIMIGEVLEDSPAEEAGLREDDIIYHFNGRDVTGEQTLREMIADTKPGDKVSVGVFRKGEMKDFTVTMGSSREAMRSMMGGMQRPLRRMMMMEMADRGRTWLGVEVLPLSEQLRDYFKVKADHGVLISSIEAQSPAQKAGLKAGDVIFKVESEDIDRRADIISALRDKNPGDMVSIEVVRGGRIKTLSAQVVEIPEKYRSMESDEGGSGFGPGEEKRIKIKKEIRGE
jgi:serine protease Do